MKILNIEGKILFESAAEEQRDVVQEAVNQGVDLSHANLRLFNLSGITLSRARLHRANLSRVNLRGASLYYCDLSHSSLEWADLKGAILRKTNFYKANLRGARLDGVFLEDSIGIYQFGPIGISGYVHYAVDWGDKVMFQIECFWGTEEEAITMVREKYGGNSLYEQQVKLAAKILKEKQI